MSGGERTPDRPWEARPKTHQNRRAIVDAHGNPVATVYMYEVDATAEFIVHACNAHDELVEALSGLLTAVYRAEAEGRVLTDRENAAIEAASAALSRARGEK